MLYIQTVIQERNRILNKDDDYIDDEDIQEQEFYEPTEEEIDEYEREKAERYWRNKT